MLFSLRNLNQYNSRYKLIFKSREFLLFTNLSLCVDYFHDTQNSFSTNWTFPVFLEDLVSTVVAGVNMGSLSMDKGSIFVSYHADGANRSFFLLGTRSGFPHSLDFNWFSRQHFFKEPCTDCVWLRCRRWW